MGIIDVVWDVHGMKDEYTGKSRGSKAGFSIVIIEKDVLGWL